MYGRSGWFLLAVFVLTAAVVSPAHAIPAFTRLYKTECSTCHTVYPELNEFGQAFYKNSFVYPGKKGEKAKEGGDQAQSGKNEALWLSALPEIVPISLTGTLNAAYDDSAADKFDLSARAIVLEAGGAFRDNVGFFLSYNLYSEGPYNPLASVIPGKNANVPSNNSPDLNELFLQWRHALGTPVNLKIGRLKPKLSLWKGTDKVTVDGFAPVNYLAIASSSAPKKSPFFVDAPEDAIEANAVIANRLFVAGGVVNRKGQNTKEGYAHASYRIGGTDFNGNEPEVDLESDSIWDYLSVTVGAFGYFGRNSDSSDFTFSTERNNFYRTGVEADVLYKRFRVRLSGVKGRDTNPDFGSHVTAMSKVGAAEAEYLFGSPINLVGAFRYEFQDDGAGITRRYIPAISYAPLQNTKVVLEYRNEEEPTRTNRIAILGVTFSI
jgi:hypothetical protein